MHWPQLCAAPLLPTRPPCAAPLLPTRPPCASPLLQKSTVAPARLRFVPSSFWWVASRAAVREQLEGGHASAAPGPGGPRSVNPHHATAAGAATAESRCPRKAGDEQRGGSGAAEWLETSAGAGAIWLRSAQSHCQACKLVVGQCAGKVTGYRNGHRSRDAWESIRWAPRASFCACTRLQCRRVAARHVPPLHFRHAFRQHQRAACIMSWPAGTRTPAPCCEMQTRSLREYSYQQQHRGALRGRHAPPRCRAMRSPLIATELHTAHCLLSRTPASTHVPHRTCPHLHSGQANECAG